MPTEQNAKTVQQKFEEEIERIVFFYSGDVRKLARLAAPKLAAIHESELSSLRSENLQLREEVERMRGEREWISVDERMPQSYAGVICGQILNGRPYTLRDLYYYAPREGWRQQVSMKLCHELISHWMPLPKGPTPPTPTTHE